METAIVNEVAPAPYSYRIFIPEIAHSVQQYLVTSGLSLSQAHRLTYLVINVLCITVILLGAVRLGSFQTIPQIGIVMFLIYAGLNVALFDHAYQPWTLVEVAILVSAILNLRRRPYLLVAFGLVATLNRETGLLLIPSMVLYAAMNHNSLLRQVWIPLTVAAFASLSLEFWIRSNRESNGTEIPVDQIFHTNVQPGSLLLFGFNVTLMFGCAAMVYLVSGHRSAREILVSLGWLAPYLLAFSVFGIWYEVRLLLIVLPFAAVLATNGISGRESVQGSI